MIRKLALAMVLAFGAMTVSAAADDREAVRSAQFTVDSAIGELLNDPGARAVLERHIPEVVADQQISQSASQSLRALAQYAPQLTEAKLAQINADLAALGGAPFFQ